MSQETITNKNYQAPPTNMPRRENLTNTRAKVTKNNAPTDHNSYLAENNYLDLAMSQDHQNCHSRNNQTLFIDKITENLPQVIGILVQIIFSSDPSEKTALILKLGSLLSIESLINQFLPNLQQSLNPQDAL